MLSSSLSSFMTSSLAYRILGTACILKSAMYFLVKAAPQIVQTPAATSLLWDSAVNNCDETYIRRM